MTDWLRVEDDDLDEPLGFTATVVDDRTGRARLREMRAAALAEPAPPPPPPSTPVLRLSSPAGDWLLPTITTDGVSEPLTVTPVPGLRAPWAGVVHRRGELVAVVDLGALGGHPSQGRHGHVLTVRGDGSVIGLLLAEPPTIAELADDDRRPGFASPVLGDDVVVNASADGAAVLDPDALVRALRAPATSPEAPR